MPDWTYRTLLRPVLFRLPFEWAHKSALRMLGCLARLPGGPAVVEFLGHMRADPRLALQVSGMSFPCSVGVGAALDPQGLALGALARFGVGFVEVGPVGSKGAGKIEHLSSRAEELNISPMPFQAGELALRLQKWSRIPVPVLIRLASCEISELRPAAERLLPYADAFVVELDDFGKGAELISTLVDAARGKPVWAGLSATRVESDLKLGWQAAAGAGAAGVWFLAEQRLSRGERQLGRSNFPAVLDRVRKFRQTFGPNPGLAAGGAHSPREALELYQAGANLIVLDTGLIFSGPGLPKRVNEAFLSVIGSPTVIVPTDEPAPARSWFWFLLMGLGMFGGGLLALSIASTRVVLPYDEVFCGMNRNQLAALNPRLLAFMAHDRVTLAGTMLTAGVLYSALSWFGIRHSLHWAKVTVAISATSGFFSFFLFLGFGYFDPFHAFVSAILFQFLLLGLHSPLSTPAHKPLPELDNSAAWRRGQWGQLLFVGLGIGLVGAGGVICAVGVTRVFVAADLEFMRTTANTLAAANPRLIPLMAHDRASLGGMLIACGLAVWLTAQLGFRAGERWLWWTLLLAGLPAFGAAITIHLLVGYLSVEHLAPAFAGLLTFALALGLSHSWLTEAESVRRGAWKSVMEQEPR